MQKKKVIVIGGGIIGLSCAYYLQRNGLKVTVLDKGEFGNACSSGNQGWVLPAVHAPIPAPGLLTTSLKWMLKKDSPLFIKPTAMPKMSSWLLKFLKHCNEANFKEGEKQLVNLSRSTLALFDELEIEGLNFEMHNEGFVQVFMNEAVFKTTVEKMEQKAREYELDSPIPLTSTEVRELEPAISQEVIGGILLKGQRHVRPDSLSKAFFN